MADPPTLQRRACLRRPGALPTVALALALAACGGGGGGNGGGGGSGWTRGVFMPSASFAARCVAPRSGNHPITGNPWPDVSGTRTDENNFLRAWSNETYLWYNEIPTRTRRCSTARSTTSASSGRPR